MSGGIETGSDPDFFGKFPEMIFERWEGVLGIWLMVLRGDGESAKMRKMSEFREMVFREGPKGPKGAQGGPWGPMRPHGAPWGPMGPYGAP